MPKVKYRSLFQKCITIVAENRNLFWPNIIMIFVSLALILLFTLSAGILPRLIEDPGVVADQAKLSELIKDVREQRPVIFWSSFGAYFLLIFLIDIFFITVKYGMIKDVLQRRKATLMDGIRFARTFYFESLAMHVFSYILVISPFFFLVGLAAMIGFNTSFFENTGAVLAFVLFVLIVFIYWIEIFFRLLFLYPTMAFEGTATFDSFREDFHYVKSHLGHTFISWMIFIGVWAFYLLFRNPVSRVADSAGSITVLIILTVITIAAEAIISTFEHTFIFKAYLEGKDKAMVKKPISTDWKNIYT